MALMKGIYDADAIPIPLGLMGGHRASVSALKVRGALAEGVTSANDVSY